MEKKEDRAGGVGGGSEWRGGGVRRDLAAVLLIKHQINGIGIELMSHKS